jgi:hypothetical protein
MKDFINETLSELVVFKPKNTKIRLGGNYDSGYIMVGGYNYDLYISGGIADAVSFDNHFYFLHPNTPGYCIDGSCNRPLNLTPDYKYIQKFIGSPTSYQSPEKEFTLLHEYTENYKNIFVKLDIEGHEWDWITNFEHLENVKQIIVECHGLFDLRTTPNGWQSIGNFHYPIVPKALNRLNKTHKLVHVHANNGGGAYNVENDVVLDQVEDSRDLPVVLELTYLRIEDSEFDGLNDIPFPVMNLDFRNFPPQPGYWNDFIIDYHPFYHKQQ